MTITSKADIANAKESGPAGGILLVKLLIVIAMFSGFINLIPVDGFMAATLFIDSIVAAMALLALITVFRGAVIEFWMIVLGVVLTVSLILMLHGPEPLEPELRAIRIQVFYAFAGLYVATTVRDRDGVISIVKLVMRLGLIIAAFGCVQFLFRRELPGWLLFSRDAPLFSYYGTDIARSTGLVGNTIIYGTLLVLIYALWLARTVWRPRVSAFACTLLVGAAILTTFSRAAISCAILITAGILVVVIWRMGPNRAVPLLALLSVGMAFLVLTLWAKESLRQTFIGSFLWRGLFLGENPTVTGSTERHYQFAAMSLESFSRHPLFGIGLGTQSQYSENAASTLVITDGFHYSTVVEGGLFLFIPTLLLLLAVIQRAFVGYRRFPSELKYIPLSVAAYFCSQVAVAGFFNTGFYGKVPNVIAWIVFGAVVAFGWAIPISSDAQNKPPPEGLQLGGECNPQNLRRRCGLSFPQSPSRSP